MVVLTSLCPSNSWTVRMSYPSPRTGASLQHVGGEGMPQGMAGAGRGDAAGPKRGLHARWTRSSNRWCRRVLPVVEVDELPDVLQVAVFGAEAETPGTRHPAHLLKELVDGHRGSERAREWAAHRESRYSMPYCILPQAQKRGSLAELDRTLR
jgi:hypothetical protein